MKTGFIQLDKLINLEKRKSNINSFKRKGKFKLYWFKHCM